MRSTISLFLLFAVAGHAGLVRFEITERRDVLDGFRFGATGAYEFLRGRAHFAVDPKLPANRRITDLSYAPRNTSGLVEFSADVVMLRPKDLRAGNRTLLVETPNRGAMGMLSLYNRAQASANPMTAAHFGDGFLMREGYTLAWVGWQHDVPKREGLLRVNVPTVSGLAGVVRGEFTPSEPGRRIPLGDAGHIPYPVSEPASLTLSVRDGIHGDRKPLAPGEWRLQGDEIMLAQPATPGRIYEFLYRSQAPAVAGLGLAALRDFAAHRKETGAEQFALGVGTSQSAMAWKALVYEGFNADEHGRRVFDGLQPHVAGGRRSTFERFAQPSRTSGPYRNASLSSTDQFPFSDTDDRELATGRRDSILERARKAGVVPKIIYTNTSYEYWGSAGALVHVSLNGRRDLALPPTTRLYLLSGGQHGPAAFPPQRGNGENLPNWNDYKWSLRAILRDLRQWVVDGTEPPPSQYPRLADRTLGPGDPPAHRTRYLDFGPEYASKGIIAHQPPKAGPDYAVLTPLPDADGNDRAGVKMPWVSVPLGAFTGWNRRTAAIGAPGELLANTGSYIPFPLDRIRKEFPGREAYLQRVEAAAGQMVRDRFLLAEDVPAMVRLGRAIWDWALAVPNGSEPTSAARANIE